MLNTIQNSWHNCQAHLNSSVSKCFISVRFYVTLSQYSKKTWIVNCSRKLPNHNEWLRQRSVTNDNDKKLDMYAKLILTCTIRFLRVRPWTAIARDTAFPDKVQPRLTCQRHTGSRCYGICAGDQFI